MARRFEDFQRLFEAVERHGCRVGVCLDTCHAWAGGEALGTAVERLRSFAGRIDLLHVNDSRDTFDSGRDRHANLGDGNVPFESILEVVAAADCDAVVETPNGPARMAEDLALLRRGLSGAV
jgi:deoxyribonuclease-4